MDNIWIPSAQTSAAYEYGVPNVYLIGTARMTSDLATIALDSRCNQDRPRLGEVLTIRTYGRRLPVPLADSDDGRVPGYATQTARRSFRLGTQSPLGSRLNWEQRLGSSCAWAHSATIRNRRSQARQPKAPAAAQPDNSGCKCSARIADQYLRLLLDQFSPTGYIGPGRRCPALS